MSKGTSSLDSPRATPKGKEKFIPPAEIARWHTVYYRASQVGRCLRPEDFKVGLAVGVLEQRLEFSGKVPDPIFYTGVVEKIWGNPDDPLVTIKYDAHPMAVNISFGIKQNYLFCIPVPAPKTKPVKTTARKTRI